MNYAEMRQQQKDHREEITAAFTQGASDSPAAVKARRRKAEAAVEKAAAAEREAAIQKELANDTEE
jgi:hypothetical protein